MEDLKMKIEIECSVAELNELFFPLQKIDKIDKQKKSVKRNVKRKVVIKKGLTKRIPHNQRLKQILYYINSKKRGVTSKQICNEFKFSIDLLSLFTKELSEIVDITRKGRLYFYKAKNSDIQKTKDLEVKPVKRTYKKKKKARHNEETKRKLKIMLNEINDTARTLMKNGMGRREAYIIAGERWKKKKEQKKINKKGQKIKDMIIENQVKRKKKGFWG